jgi:hypothetical protein
LAQQEPVVVVVVHLDRDSEVEVVEMGEMEEVEVEGVPQEETS